MVVSALSEIFIGRWEAKEGGAYNTITIKHCYYSINSFIGKSVLDNRPIRALSFEAPLHTTE